MLTQATSGAVRPPRVAALHLGLGAFHRAHQLWATELANRDAEQRGEPAAAVGYASFTGRRRDAATALAAQDGLYHLLIRAADGDRAELIRALVAPSDGADTTTLRSHAASPDVGVVTLTITEAGYRRSGDGGLARDDPDVGQDLETLRAHGADLRTAPGRLVDLIRTRADLGVPPLAVVSCDNLLDNGSSLRRVVMELAAGVDDATAAAVTRTPFAGTMVDRITPHTTAHEREAARELTGYDDAEPVACEPFTEWLLAGEFPSGRPAWEHGGARFVDDVQPFEQRKLWLLNGAHSLLAYVGALRGHETVDQAMADPECASLMERWWDDASAHLSLPPAEIVAYRSALTERFHNPRIRHQLAQIAVDGSQKLPIRIVPVVTAVRADGGAAEAGVTTLGAWLVHLRGRGPSVRDVVGDRLMSRSSGPLTDAAAQVLEQLGPGLGDDRDLVVDVAAAARRLEGS